MLSFELKGFISRRSFLLLIVAAIILNVAVMLSIVDKKNEYGYGYKDINEIYAALPSDGELAVARVNEIIKNTDNLGSLKDEYLYREILERLIQASDYTKYLEDMQAEIGFKLSSPFFSAPGTFSYRNLEVSRNAYSGMADIRPEAVSSCGVEAAVGNRISDVILTFLALLLCLGLLTLQKEDSTLSLIKPMKNGRSPLLASKFATMTLGCLVFTIVIYGTNIAVAHAVLDLNSLARPIQSIYGYQSCRFRLSVGGYLACFLAIKYLWLMAVSSIIFCICVFMRSSFGACLASLGIMAIDFLHYGPPSPWLRYTSLLWMSDSSWYFSHYYNLNLFGYPVDSFTVSILIFIIIIAMMSCISFYRFASEDSVYGHRSRNFSVLTGCGRHTGLFRHECYKLMVLQGGLLILVIFCTLQIMRYTDKPYYRETYETYYAEKLAGAPSERQERFIRDEESAFGEIHKTLDSYYEKYKAGQISEDIYDYLKREYSGSLDGEQAFERARSKYRRISEIAGKQPGVEYIDEQPYRYIIGQAALDSCLPDIALLALALVLGLSDIFCVERLSHVDILQCYAIKRRRLLGCKLALAAIYAVAAALIAFLPNIIAAGVRLGYKGIGADASSLLFLTAAPHGMTVLALVAATVGAALAASCLAASLVLLISKKTVSRTASILGSSFVLLLPIILLLL